MPHRSQSSGLKQPWTIPLRWMLVVPFAVQIVAGVGIVGYLSYRSGQRAVETLAEELMHELDHGIQQHLKSYVGRAQEINQTNLTAVETGVLDLKDFDALGQYFYRQMRQFNFSYVNFGGADGSFIGAGYGLNQAREIAEIPRSNPNRLSTYSVDDQGNRLQLIDLESHPQTNQANWYRDAVQAGKPIWSSIYPYGDLPDHISISASAPVYDPQGKLQGVLGIDLELTHLSRVLQTLNHDRSGVIFIIERSGLMIASSAAESPAPIVGGQAQRLAARQSREPLIRDVTQALIEQFGGLKAIAQPALLRPDLAGQPFVKVTPYRDDYGLDWLIVTVIPEAKFMGEIRANAQQTWLLCGLVLLVTLSGSLLTARWIAQPILRLTHASQALARGEWQEAMEKNSSTTEISLLFLSFNRMLEQLKLSFTRIKTALEESEEKFTTIFMTSPDPIAITTADQGGHYLEVNDSFLTLTEYSREELIGKNSAELELSLDLQQDQTLRRLLETEGSVRDFEFNYRTKSGKTGTALLSLETVELDGQLRIITIAKDISDRKRAVAVLRESEERFRRAFDDAAIGMALVALDGKLFQVNRAICQIIGYSEPDLLQQNFQTLTHPDDLSMGLENMRRLVSGEQHSFQMEKRCLHKQGHVVWTSLSVSLIRDHQGTPLYLVCQVQDISDRHSAERIKDEFIAVVSHELRTPLSAIRGSLGLLKSGKLDHQPEKFNQILQMAVNNSDRLVQLINDILDLERLESGSVQLVRGECHVADLIAAALEAIQPLAYQAAIEIKWTPIPATVYANHGAIVQVLTNLLSNAIKFSPPYTIVGINVEFVGIEDFQRERFPSLAANLSLISCPCLLFSIHDQGRGIPPENLQSIFERFQQVDASDSRQKGGTGLGLAICKSIVQLHKGQIWVKSVVGQGSTFYFTLPLAIRKP